MDVINDAEFRIKRINEANVACGRNVNRETPFTKKQGKKKRKMAISPVTFRDVNVKIGLTSRDNSTERCSPFAKRFFFSHPNAHF